MSFFFCVIPSLSCVYRLGARGGALVLFTHLYLHDPSSTLPDPVPFFFPPFRSTKQIAFDPRRTVQRRTVPPAMVRRREFVIFFASMHRVPPSPAPRPAPAPLCDLFFLPFSVRSFFLIIIVRPRKIKSNRPTTDSPSSDGPTSDSPSTDGPTSDSPSSDGPTT